MPSYGDFRISPSLHNNTSSLTYLLQVSNGGLYGVVELEKVGESSCDGEKGVNHRVQAAKGPRNAYIAPYRP